MHDFNLVMLHWHEGKESEISASESPAGVRNTSECSYDEQLKPLFSDQYRTCIYTSFIILRLKPGNSVTEVILPMCFRNSVTESAQCT